MSPLLGRPEASRAAGVQPRPHGHAGFTEEQERRIEQGIAAGQEQLEELVFGVPASIVESVAELDAVLDEADQWCRQDQMLVLATPPDLVAYRRWYLEEFRRQVAGESPRPWDGPLR